MTRRDYFQMLSAGAAVAGAVQIANAAAGDSDRERGMKWWHEARFGMFIHWGLYSTLGRHEWAMENEAIPVAEYQQLAKTSSPSRCRAGLGETREAGRAEIHGDDHQT